MNARLGLESLNLLMHSALDDIRASMRGESVVPSFVACKVADTTTQNWKSIVKRSSSRLLNTRHEDSEKMHYLDLMLGD